MDIQDKIVWITGASSGIGEALVYEFVKNGAKVVISARRETELQRVKQNCPVSENVEIVPLDLANYEDMFKKQVNTVIDKFGRIDILVNNGGISQRSFVVDTDLSVYKKIMDVNYFGTIALTKSVLPYMIKQKSGMIIVTSSLVGKFGTHYRSGYSASKHALHGFFDSLRSEVWDDNIKIMIVLPGFIRTNVTQNALVGDGSKYNKMDDVQANGMPPEKVAEEIIKAVKKEKFEIVVGRKEVLAVYLKRFFPNFFTKFIRKQKVK